MTTDEWRVGSHCSAWHDAPMVEPFPDAAGEIRRLHHTVYPIRHCWRAVERSFYTEHEAAKVGIVKLKFLLCRGLPYGIRLSLFIEGI